MRTLLLDNYDSFTYNLFQLLAEVNGEEPVVVRNDAAEWAELAAREDFDNIVVSPGPGSPEREADFGVCAAAIRESELPLLGVCLGHQGLCAVHGAGVVRADEAMHGRLSSVRHDGSGLFAGLPPSFDVVRYHSLCVEEPLPPSLRPVAWAEDGTLMAVAHRERPQWGLQFHPESVCSEQGRALLANFRDLSTRRRTVAPRPRLAKPATPPPAELELLVERVETPPSAERAFVHLYGASENAFWLDSGAGGAEPARFSFMGDASGPLALTVSYDVGSGELRLRRGGQEERRRESIFDYLAAELRRPPPRGPELPFEFGCGFAGYLGYELKAECGGDRAHASPLPDAFLVFADRMLAFDHQEGVAYLLGLCRPAEAAATQRWLTETRQRLATLPPLAAPEPAAATDPHPPFRLARSRQRYLEDIAVCQARLGEGQSYEICLTNKIEVEAEPDPLDLYRALRRVNPAPYAAYLRLGAAAVLSSSPERFLAVDRERGVEARPIKGTARRGADPGEDGRLAAGLRLGEKTRAENLTICDLLRNDLGVVCEVGSVHVPALMQVESYETVHQLVTTVRGRLREGLGAVECVRACFPGGSMTGAPKRRTMQIIDALEGEARGVYSGALGYFGLGGGCDLSIVIRTVVVAGGKTTIGIGGAIVTQSDPEDEFEETLLKGEAPLRAIDPVADPRAAAEPALS